MLVPLGKCHRIVVPQGSVSRALSINSVDRTPKLRCIKTRLITGYRSPRSDSTIAAGCRAGEGLPSSAATVRTFRALYDGKFLGAAIRIFTPSMAFTVTDSARLLLSPGGLR